MSLSKFSQTIVLTIACVFCFVLGSMTYVTSAEKQQTLEQRVESLELQTKSLSGEVWYLKRMTELGRLQAQQALSGTYIATLHSTSEHSIVYFLHSPDKSSNDVAYKSIKPDGAILTLSEGNLEVARVDLTKIVQPGDYLIAWMDKNSSTCSLSGYPCSPDEWRLPAFYWDKQSGFAVAVMHLDGTSAQSDVIVK